jgi:hypothetical protein
MAKPVTLRHLTAFGDDPTERVTLFLGDGPDAEQSSQWISAQVTVDMQPLKSLALLRIKALNAMRDLIDGETRRLSEIYSQAEKALR